MKIHIYPKCFLYFLVYEKKVKSLKHRINSNYIFQLFETIFQDDRMISFWEKNRP